MFKIIQSAAAGRIVEDLEAFGLYEYLQPNASELLKKSALFRGRYMKSLADLNGNGSPGEALAALIRDYLEDFVDWDGGVTENYKNAFFEARHYVLPINPPRTELDHAVRRIFGEHGITIKKTRFIERGKPRFSLAEAPGPVDPPEGEPQKRRRRRRRPRGGGNEGGSGE
jgi:poly(A) polymerase